ncbi:MAG: hypothetical protein KDH15_13710 [Rhodocyclaceae bacterium]|nr:hypothetical protein [Rhodocyclaceae bacterium]
MKRLLGLGLLWLVVAPAPAGQADVVNAEAHCDSRRVCRFDVTVRHDDEGWNHYADRWDVLAPDGQVLGSRVLLHPHVAEQPFTRSLGGVVIPPELESVRIRAHDKLHGHGGREFVVRLP